MPVLIGVASFDESGNQGVAFVLDLTERKRAEEAVRRSEEELREVIETIPAMVWTALPDGNVEFINRRWQEFTGSHSGRKLGMELEKPQFHPDDIEPYSAKWTCVLGHGRTLRGGDASSAARLMVNIAGCMSSAYRSR